MEHGGAGTGLARPRARAPRRLRPFASLPGERLVDGVGGGEGSLVKALQRLAVGVGGFWFPAHSDTFLSCFVCISRCGTSTPTPPRIIVDQGSNPSAAAVSRKAKLSVSQPKLSTFICTCLYLHVCRNYQEALLVFPVRGFVANHSLFLPSKRIDLQHHC